MNENLVNLREIPENSQASALREALEALSPGGAIHLLTASDPRPLIRTLMESHWGRFLWAPLGDNSEGVRSVLIRPERPVGSLTDLMEADHRRCDALFADMENAAGDGDQSLTEALFKSFDLGMRRHFSMEEEGFFEAFDQRMGMMGGGPVAVMKEEHGQIRGLLEQMGGALGGGDLTGFQNGCETLLYMMEQHNMKEEQMLYPMADDALAPELDTLLKRLMLY